MTLISIAMSVLTNQKDPIELRTLIKAMQAIVGLVEHIDQREYDILKTSYATFIGILRTCPFVRFRENRECLKSSKVSLLSLNTVNRYEFERWGAICAVGGSPPTTP